MAGLIRTGEPNRPPLVYPCNNAVYHITCVDSTSQWQIEACVQGISEAFLLPVLELVIAQFPFVIEGFHSDNVKRVF